MSGRQLVHGRAAALRRNFGTRLDTHGDDSRLHLVDHIGKGRRPLKDAHRLRDGHGGNSVQARAKSGHETDGQGRSPRQQGGAAQDGTGCNLGHHDLHQASVEDTPALMVKMQDDGLHRRHGMMNCW